MVSGEGLNQTININNISGYEVIENLIINPSNVNESASISFNNAGYLTNINANFSGNLSFTFNSYEVEVSNIRISITGSVHIMEV